MTRTGFTSPDNLCCHLHTGDRRVGKGKEEEAAGATEGGIITDKADMIPTTSFFYQIKAEAVYFDRLGGGRVLDWRVISEKQVQRHEG